MPTLLDAVCIGLDMRSPTAFVDQLNGGGNQVMVLKSALMVGAIFATHLTFESSAHAQVPAAVYEDIKGVIEDLLAAEISQTVVPNLVCVAGRTTVPGGTPKAIELTVKGADGKDAKVYFTFQAMDYFPRTLQLIYNRQFGSLKTTVVDEVADFTSFIVYKVLAESKISGEANVTNIAIQSAKIAGKDEEKEKPNTGAPAATLTYGALGESQFSECSKNVSKAIKSGVFAIDGISALDAACAANNEGRKEFACDIAHAVQATLLKKPALAEEHLIRAVAAVIGERYSSTLDAPTFNRLLLTIRTLLTASGNDDAALAKAAFDSIATIDTKAVADAKLQELLTSLRIQWRVIANSSLNSISVASFFTETITSLSVICADSKLSSCAKVKELSDKSLALWEKIAPFVQLAARGQLRDVAHRAVLATFQDISASECRDSSSSGCTNIDLYRRFADSVVMYVIDLEQSNSPSEGSREAFRSAATDVIQVIARGGGFDRRYGQTIILPDLALRFSWNAGYVNGGDTAFRTLPSANMLNFRIPLVYRPMSYSAIQFSLIDPLAPLGELATRRPSTQFDMSEKMAVNVISPRIDVLIGVPALTKHLVVGAGASIRPVVPLLASDLSTAATPTTAAIQGFRYEYIWDKSDQWPRYIEFGFVAKYLL